MYSAAAEILNFSRNLSRKTPGLSTFKRKLLELKINSFRPKIQFSFDFKGYTIKTVDDPAELWEVLKLRCDIFTKQYGVKMKFEDVDFDKYDLLGDHVILICNTSHRIVGTYRLICSTFSSEFYSENEFNLSKLKKSSGVKLELGRACIHEDYRTGSSISLVWRGMTRYIVLSGADYLFGCTSIKTMSPRISQEILKYCKSEAQGNKFDIQPTKKYRYKVDLQDQVEAMEGDPEIEKYIPSLMKSYMSAGAKVYGQPALDKDFKCTDFFTLLDVENMTPNYYKRYVKPWKQDNYNSQGK